MKTDPVCDFPPAPRLQLTWRKPNKRELRKKSYLGAPDWMCDYQLILPVGDGDIRKPKDGSEVAIRLGQTRITTSATEVFHTPFRDGCHAQWDAKALGGLPIFVVGSDGKTREYKAQAPCKGEDRNHGD